MPRDWRSTFAAHYGYRPAFVAEAKWRKGPAGVQAGSGRAKSLPEALRPWLFTTKSSVMGWLRDICGRRWNSTRTTVKRCTFSVLLPTGPIKRNLHRNTSKWRRQSRKTSPARNSARIKLMTAAARVSCRPRIPKLITGGDRRWLKC